MLCDAANLVLDPQHVRAAPCPKHRPHYMCSFGKTYNRYQPGAFQLACHAEEAGLQLMAFPQDHLQDIMEALQAQGDANSHLQVLKQLHQTSSSEYHSDFTPVVQLMILLQNRHYHRYYMPIRSAECCHQL